MSDKTEDAQLRISDFGSSVKLNSHDEKCRFKIGTPGYTSPEVYKNEPYGLKIDIWGIGIIMFVILTAKLPF